MRRRKQSGQAIMLVVLAVGLVLMGGLGLAVDAGQLYGHRQMAQVAADAAAEAGILSIYSKTNTGTNLFGSEGVTGFDCNKVTTDLRSPCAYARINGFGAVGSGDTVHVDFPTAVTGVKLSTKFTPAAVHVLITRPVGLTLIRLLGAAASKSVLAAGTAAITDVVQAVPIIIMHPTMDSAFQMGGGTLVKICGGPQESIHVNSDNTYTGKNYAIDIGSGTVDLSKGGPTDTAGNCGGTGTDLSVLGGPSSTLGNPSWLTMGTTTHYYSASPPIPDPLDSVSPPAVPADAPAPKTGVLPGMGSCPLAMVDLGGIPILDDTGVQIINTNPCTIFFPGKYPTALDTTAAAVNGINVPTGVTAVFNPGTYYISSAPGSGTFKDTAFGTQSTSSTALMCVTGCTADTSGCCSGGGMMVYIADGRLSFSGNSAVNLVGSDLTSSYLGILFFGSHTLPLHSGSSSHKLGGGASMSLQGSIYFTNTRDSMLAAPDTYQTLSLGGGSGSGTAVRGQIIVDSLTLQGGGTIQMKLTPDKIFTVAQVALVN